MSPTMIAKRAFLSAVACRAQGWYQLRVEREPITPALEWRFHVGAEVEKWARGELGDGVRIGWQEGTTAQALTARALADPEARVVFEATFSTGPFIARADALRRHGDGWDLIEVKSGKAPETGLPRDEYLDDLAFTAFVAQAAGLPIARCSFLLIDPQLQVGQTDGILREVDATAAILARGGDFQAMAPAIAAALTAGERPEPRLELVCRACPFFHTRCLGVGIPDPVVALPNLSAQRLDRLRSFHRISLLPPDADLTPNQRRVAQVVRSGSPLVEADGLAQLDAIEWPAHYLDFESVNPAFPWFAGAKPYQAIPFQYSLHVRESFDHPPAHDEYLAPIGSDWRRELAERLLDRLGDHGSILVYSPYERRMLGYFGGVLPDLAPRFDQVAGRLFDLERIIDRGYVHPGFLGRTSIKQVVPVMVPELDYSALDISAGDDAAAVFALMWVGQYGSGDHDRHRRNLLAYCRLDTLAMVRLHEALEKVRAEALS